MNRHFRDARYYARRTASELAAGVREELSPVAETARDAAGRTPEPEPERSRRDRVRGRARNAVRGVRQRT